MDTLHQKAWRLFLDENPAVDDGLWNWDALAEAAQQEYIDKVKAHIPGGSTPQQYALPENATELQDLIEYRDLNFAQGNIFKAIYRCRTCSHSDALRDMNKIKWFAEREITRLIKEKEK